MQLAESPITAEKVRKGTCFNACLVDKSIGCASVVGDRPHNMEGNKEGKVWGWGIAKDQILLLAYLFLLHFILSIALFLSFFGYFLCWFCFVFIFVCLFVTYFCAR